MKKRILYAGKCFYSYDGHDDLIFETERDGNFIEFNLNGEELEGDIIEYRIFTLDNVPDEWFYRRHEN